MKFNRWGLGYLIAEITLIVLFLCIMTLGITLTYKAIVIILAL